LEVMRLLNTSTLVVDEFFSNPPEYVILSHTWGEEEVTLQDMMSGCTVEKRGWAKISGCCKKALADGFSYCWIDTCCTIQTHHRRQRPTKRVAHAAEIGGRMHMAF
jgi:hypothetical protein